MPEAQAVARMSRERRVEAQRREMAANGGVDVAGGRAGLQARPRRRAGRRRTRRKARAGAGVGPAPDGERVGEVAAVARDDHREVEQEQVARLDLPRRRRAPLLGRHTGGRTRSRRRRSPASPQRRHRRILDDQIGVELGHPRPHFLERRRQARFAGPHRAAQDGDLIRVFRSPQRPDHAGRYRRSRAPGVPIAGPRRRPRERRQLDADSVAPASSPGGRASI